MIPHTQFRVLLKVAEAWPPMPCVPSGKQQSCNPLPGGQLYVAGAVQRGGIERRKLVDERGRLPAGHRIRGLQGELQVARQDGVGVATIGVSGTSARLVN